jgi:hypothetical protein
MWFLWQARHRAKEGRRCHGHEQLGRLALSPAVGS